jgi:peroxiredoxin
MRNLMSGAAIAVAAYVAGLGAAQQGDVAVRGGVSVLMFFVPECPYCDRQARVLNELQRECRDLHAVAIGINGDRRALQQEAARMRALLARVDAAVCAVD